MENNIRLQSNFSDVKRIQRQDVPCHPNESVIWHTRSPKQWINYFSYEKTLKYDTYFFDFFFLIGMACVLKQNLEVVYFGYNRKWNSVKDIATRKYK